MDLSQSDGVAAHGQSPLIPMAVTRKFGCVSITFASTSSSPSEQNKCTKARARENSTMALMFGPVFAVPISDSYSALLLVVIRLPITVAIETRGSMDDPGSNGHANTQKHPKELEILSHPTCLFWSVNLCRPAGISRRVGRDGKIVLKV